MNMSKKHVSEFDQVSKIAISLNECMPLFVLHNCRAIILGWE